MSNSQGNLLRRIVDGPLTSRNSETLSGNTAQTCAECGRETKRKYCGKACYRIAQRSIDPVARFWAKVHKSEGCWPWTGNTVGGNRSEIPYGQFSLLAEDGTRRHVYAHRYVWEITNGPIPDGIKVCHSCDNPLCVRPSHLFLGTQAENLKDAADKGRFHVPRPNHPRRKLSDEDVAMIKVMRQGGMTLDAIGARFGVTKTCVSRIVNGHARTYSAPQLQAEHQKASGF